jgi:hypothetical protein
MQVYQVSLRHGLNDKKLLITKNKIKKHSELINKYNICKNIHIVSSRNIYSLSSKIIINDNLFFFVS